MKVLIVASRYCSNILGGRKASTQILADALARGKLGWKRKMGFGELIQIMVKSDLQLVRTQTAPTRFCQKSELQESKCDC